VPAAPTGAGRCGRLRVTFNLAYNHLDPIRAPFGRFELSIRGIIAQRFWNAQKLGEWTPSKEYTKRRMVKRREQFYSSSICLKANRG